MRPSYKIGIKLRSLENLPLAFKWEPIFLFRCKSQYDNLIISVNRVSLVFVATCSICNKLNPKKCDGLLLLYIFTLPQMSLYKTLFLHL